MQKITITILIFLSSSFFYASAQEIEVSDVTPTNCGDIIQGEFTSNFEQHLYGIELNPGDQLDVSVVPVGNQLNTGIPLFGPTGLVFAISDRDGMVTADGKYSRLETERTPKVNTGALSARGTYLIGINNYSWVGILSNSGGVGVYTLFIGCTLNDGTEIKPGQSSPEPTVILPTNVPTRVPTDATFLVFPGISPVSFQGAFIVPLSIGTPFPATINPGSSGVLGLQFSASEGQTLELSLRRLSGNINVGVVVLSENGEVAFQSSLINLNTLLAEFVLPSAGQFTIGVFEIDLLSPDNPEPTQFEVKANLKS